MDHYEQLEENRRIFRAFTKAGLYCPVFPGSLAGADMAASGAELEAVAADDNGTALEREEWRYDAAQPEA